jgi:hypothetical protein
MEVQCRSIFKGAHLYSSAFVIYIDIGAQGNIDFEARNWSQIGQAPRFSNAPAKDGAGFKRPRSSIESGSSFVGYSVIRPSGGRARAEKKCCKRYIDTVVCCYIQPGHKAISLSEHTASQRGAPHTFQPYCHCYDYFMTPVRHGVMPIIIDSRSPPHQRTELISRKLFSSA